MNLEPVLYVIGRLCTLLAVVLGAPLVLSVVDRGLGTPVTNAFVVTAAISLGLGYALRLSFEWEGEHFGIAEAFATITGGWLVYTALGSLPFVLTGVIPSVLDASFEVLSGLTTTGATVVADPSDLPLALLFWRTMTGWIGGLGFLAVSVAILPVLGAGGNFVHDADVSGADQEKLLPRLATAASRLWMLYLASTLVFFGAFWFAGLSPFEGLNQAMSVVATCGFSTRSDSLASFTPAAQWAAVAGMFLAGLNIVLLRQILVGRPGLALRNPELRLYALVWVVVCAVLAIGLQRDAGVAADGLEPVLRRAAFAGSSAISTTGLSMEPIASLPHLLRLLLLMAVGIGACSASTGGGFKMFRIVLLAKAAFREVDRLLRPAAVYVVKVGRRPLPDVGVMGVGAFLVMHLVVLGLASLALMFLGLPMETALDAVVSALSNAGNHHVGVVGATTWNEVPGLAKLVLMACMLLGRLEFYAVLVLLVPLAWRR